MNVARRHEQGRFPAANVRLIGALAAFVVGACVGWPAGARAQDVVAVVLKATNDVRQKAPDASKWEAARKGQLLVAGHQIRTREGAFCAIVFRDDRSLLKITENTEVELREAGLDDEGRFTKRIWVGVGGVWASVPKQDRPRFAIETPTSVASVSGSEGYDIVDTGGFSTLYCIEGVWGFSNPFGRVEVNPGFQALSNGQDPPELTPAPADAVPTFSQDNPIEGDGGGGGGDAGERSRELRIGMEDEDGTQRTLIIRYREMGQP